MAGSGLLLPSEKFTWFTTFVTVGEPDNVAFEYSCAVKPDALGGGLVGVGFVGGGFVGCVVAPQLTVAEPNFDAPGAGSPPQLSFEKVSRQDVFPEQAEETY